MGYYEVKAKCGHVGRNNYILKRFYIKANNGKEAAKTVKAMPRVKHHQKDVIQSVSKISLVQYDLGRKAMEDDMYFRVTNKQEQTRTHAVEEDEIFREIEKKEYKNSHFGRFLREKEMEKEWKKLEQGGYQDYE